ncbi:MAG: hypothetical protein OER12_10175 [Acidimicrobiia bacterium]|nr:hypothetical protein [Acidimicrobiia bacterium]
MNRVARVGVAVDPPLLADLLVRLFDGPNRTIRRHPTSKPEGYDLAIVSPSHAPTLSAPCVIRLPDDNGGSGLGVVTTEAGWNPVSISDVADISILVEAHLSG